MDGYDSDLAYIHDVGFNFFALGAAPFLLESLKQADIHDGLIVDLGCGSGLWAETLDRAGYDVLGVDMSPNMIELSQQRVPNGAFQVNAVIDASLPSCRAITALGEIFNYRFDERNSWDALREVWRKLYAALQPGGLLIFDIAEPGRSKGQQKGHWHGDDWALMVEYEHDESFQSLTRHITTFRQLESGHYRRSSEVHHLLLYNANAIAFELRQIGFHVRILRSYGQLAFPDSSYAGFIARKDD